MYSNQISEDQKSTLELVILITRKVVARYISMSAIPYREREDVEMAVVEKFINKKNKIHQSFQGKSKITTYYTAIINRMCCEIIRKEQKHWYSVLDDRLSEENGSRTLFFESAKETIIKDEVRRLTNALLFFNGERHKVNLYLKYYFDIPLKNEDFEIYYSTDTKKVQEILKNRDGLKKSEVFHNLSQVMNLVESKNVGADAVRIWLNKQIDIILDRLNANGQYNYNQESLSILFEIYSQN
ncbi:MAG: hypothetical protein ACOCWC_04180 [Bacteroidota bacterium]